MFAHQFQKIMKNLLFITIFILVGIYSAAGVSCPTIISRAQWGARPASTSALTTFPPTHVFIHHAASASCSTQTACAALVRSFQNMHIDTNGWSDIGYNFLVGGDGQIYEGRGWGKTGAHVVNYNSRSIGICFIGTFINSLPTTAALNAAQQLIACGVSNGQISSSYRLAGHRQGAATECPGQTLYNLITSWPNWTSNP